jgi:hypothetical protein
MSRWDTTPAIKEPSWGSALPVYAKVGYDASERGAELGLGVPGG